ncbi:MAG: PAS domain S-box protein [Rhodospirillales bacterium]|nr:PAS domain S-box protein [Rhodospirillales bacterium]
MAGNNAGPKQPLDRRSAIILAVTLLVVVLFALGCLASYRNLFDERQAQARAEAVRMLRAFEAHSMRLFDHADSYLRAMRAYYDVQKDYDRWERFVAEVREPKADLFAGIVSIVDREGWIVYQSETPRAKLKDYGTVTELDHYQYYRKHPGDSVFVGATRIGRVTGKQQFRVGRPLLRDGVFDGLIVVTLLPQHITDFYKSLSLGANSTVTMVTLEPKLIARQPPAPEALYDRAIPNLKENFGIDFEREGGGTVLGIVSPFDQVKRDVFYKKLRSYPVAVVVGITEGDLKAGLADSRRNLILLASAFALISLAVCSLVLRLVDKNRLVEDASARLQTSQRQLARVNEILEARVEERTVDLRASENRLRKLSRAVEQSPNMIFITDRDGVIEYANPRFSQMTGYRLDEVLGQNPRLLKSAETPAELYQDLWRTILEGRDWHGVVKDRRKDGQAFWASVSISPVRDETGAITHFVSMHQDITERKLMEESTRLAKEEAELSSRAKSEMLANMSHELRTPLNAVLGFSEMLLSGVFGQAPSPKFAEYLKDINSSGLHLLELINEILDVSAIEAGKMILSEDEVLVPEIVDVALRLIRPRAMAGKVRLLSDLEPNLPRLRADPRRMKQILLNLLSNAVKFTPDGGTVTMRARRDEAGAMELSVADTGIGMDQAGIATALTKFGQVDSGLARRHEGTGLGLPLAQGLVELHGGTLTIASAKGVGTTVTVTLPASRIVA